MPKSDKTTLRTVYLDRRKSLSAEFLAEASKNICDRLISAMQWENLLVHVFIPIQRFDEPNTWPLIRSLWERPDVAVCTSVSDLTNHSLSHFELTPSTPLKQNKWGIEEPQNGKEVSSSDIDRVIIPLLAYDKSGHRVGYGRGFYDRFLAECRTDVEKIGVSFFAPEEEIRDTSSLDIRLSACVTPKEVYHF